MVALPDAPLFAGLVLSWSLAAPPGPVNALIAEAAARRGFWSGWWIGFGAILGDMTMLALALLGFLRVLETLPWLGVALAALGAGLMLFFAYGAWRSARVGPSVVASGSALRASVATSYVLVVTSPFNWGWWLTAGSSTLALFGWSLAAGFFLGLLLWIAAWSALATTGARIRRFSEIVGYAAAFTLVVFAGIMAWSAATGARALLA